MHLTSIYRRSEFVSRRFVRNGQSVHVVVVLFTLPQMEPIGGEVILDVIDESKTVDRCAGQGVLQSLVTSVPKERLLLTGVLVAQENNRIKRKHDTSITDVLLLQYRLLQLTLCRIITAVPTLTAHTLPYYDCSTDSYSSHFAVLLLQYRLLQLTLCCAQLPALIILVVYSMSY